MSQDRNEENELDESIDQIVDNEADSHSDSEDEKDIPDLNEEESDSEDTAENTVEEEDEVIVSIGDDEPEAKETSKAPSWVNEVRVANRQLNRENKELKNKLDALLVNNEPKDISVPSKPTLADCDYDEDVLGEKLDQWYDVKKKHDEQEFKKNQKQREEEAAWKTRVSEYQAKKDALKVSDFEDAEILVGNTLSIVQQGIIINGADNPELVVYALGKNPKKAKELASISDPIKFSIALGKLETQLKVRSQTKPSTRPEGVIKGTGGTPKDNSTIERLREEARKTGDFSKVYEYQNRNKT